MEKTGSQIIVECLEREGVEVIFGIPGGQLLPFFDALYHSKVRTVLTRHEQGAAHMADGYARSTGKVGVCTATSGPGATNLVTGLATAYMDSIPVVAITGQVKTSVIGSDAFQEADAIGCTRSITKHNFLVKDVNDLARTIREAFYIARTGRQGPVHVDVPSDIQMAKTNFVYPEKVQIRSYVPCAKPDLEQVRAAAELIKKAKRPVLYVGGGAISSGASEILRAFAEKSGIPVTATLMGNGAIPFDHPLYIGPLGMHGTYAANMMVHQCDLLISCGARFDDRVTGKLSAFSPHSKKIHFDIDPSNVGKTVPVDVAVLGDLKLSLKELIRFVPRASHRKWVDQVKLWDKKHPLKYRTKPSDEYVLPQHVIEEIHKMTGGEAMVVTGVGQHQMWAMQWYPARFPRHFLSSGGLGTMGFGFPAAIGAKIANPKKQVFCIDGDGCFQMTMMEMATSVQEKAKIIVIILDNHYLGMVRQWQELFYGNRFSGTCLVVPSGRRTKENEAEIPNIDYVPDFVKWAESYGALGIRVTRKDEIRPALERAMRSPVSVVIDFMTPPSEKVFPMVPGGASIDDIIIDMA